MVKTLVSSREEGDLVYELREYPSLKIAADRSSTNIKRYVQTEVDTLMNKRRLLRDSQAKDAIKATIIASLLKKADGV